MPYLSTVGIPDKSYHESRKCSVVSHEYVYIICVYINEYVFVHVCIIIYVFYMYACMHVCIKHYERLQL